MGGGGPFEPPTNKRGGVQKTGSKSSCFVDIVHQFKDKGVFIVCFHLAVSLYVRGRQIPAELQQKRIQFRLNLRIEFAHLLSGSQGRASEFGEFGVNSDAAWDFA